MIYPVIIRHILYRLMERCSSIEFRSSLMTMCCFLLLSFFTTIIANIFLQSFIFTSSSSSSSSLSLFTSNHIFFPADVLSLQSSHHHQLQMHNQRQELASKQRTYTRDQSKQKNISNGKIILRHCISMFYSYFSRSSSRS